MRIWFFFAYSFAYLLRIYLRIERRILHILHIVRIYFAYFADFAYFLDIRQKNCIFPEYFLRILHILHIICIFLHVFICIFFILSLHLSYSAYSAYSAYFAYYFYIWLQSVLPSGLIRWYILHIALHIFQGEGAKNKIKMPLSAYR